jgi:carbonic anhydrase/acetyltransferase-like protein (isoleucine patch superfamily)
MEFHSLSDRLSHFLYTQPEIAVDAYVAPNATVIGRVSIGSGSSVWYQAVIRGDINEIRIGEKTNIQDGSILHVADRYGLVIGNEVCCGHRAILHACQIHDRVLIGMGATVMDGAEVGSGSVIGAHRLITKGMLVPPGSLVMGAPGKVVRSLQSAEIDGIAELAAKYQAIAQHYRTMHLRSGS